jgi:phosphopantetheine--protein transferase-like protein
MVVGVGIDLVEISRIAKLWKKESFIRRTLTETEEAYCNTAAKVAGRWAAKEAIIKAIGIDIVMRDIEILNNALGQPQVRIFDHRFDSARMRIYVSITHEKTHAAAVAVIERIVMQVPI